MVVGSNTVLLRVIALAAESVAMPSPASGFSHGACVSDRPEKAPNLYVVQGWAPR